MSASRCFLARISCWWFSASSSILSETILYAKDTLSLCQKQRQKKPTKNQSKTNKQTKNNKNKKNTLFTKHSFDKCHFLLALVLKGPQFFFFFLFWSHFSYRNPVFSCKSEFQNFHVLSLKLKYILLNNIIAEISKTSYKIY